MKTQTDIDEEELFRIIAQTKTDGEPWFEIKLTTPYAESQQENVDIMMLNLANVLNNALGLMAEDIDAVALTKDGPRIQLI